MVRGSLLACKLKKAHLNHIAEHIWWDQGTALKQAGLLPDILEVPTANGPRKLKLPVADEACARLLVNESDGVCNEMLDWGYQD